jgi:hypothetical protein
MAGSDREEDIPSGRFDSAPTSRAAAPSAPQKNASIIR